jgi:hypothetical protein
VSDNIDLKYSTCVTVNACSICFRHLGGKCRCIPNADGETSRKAAIWKTERIILKLILWKWTFGVSDIGPLDAGTRTSEVVYPTNYLVYPIDNPHFDIENNSVLDLITEATYYCRYSYGRRQLACTLLIFDKYHVVASKTETIHTCLCLDSLIC